MANESIEELVDKIITFDNSPIYGPFDYHSKINFKVPKNVILTIHLYDLTNINISNDSNTFCYGRVIWNKPDSRNL